MMGSAAILGAGPGMHGRPRSARDARRRRAMTLMEVLVASVVLALGAVLGMAAIGSSLSLTSDLEAKAEAQRIAADRLALVAGGALPPPASDRITRGNLAYTWRVETRPEAGGLMRLRCVVEWKKRGVTRRFELERLVAEEGGAP